MEMLTSHVTPAVSTQQKTDNATGLVTRTWTISSPAIDFHDVTTYVTESASYWTGQELKFSFFLDSGGVEGFVSARHKAASPIRSMRAIQRYEVVFFTRPTENERVIGTSAWHSARMLISETTNELQYTTWGGWVYIKRFKRTRFLFCLTHSLMELSSSWESVNCAATQELPSILWNPKVHYRVHKSPPLFPILSQIDPIHIILSYLCKIHFNIVHPPTSWSSQWSLSYYHEILPPNPVPI
jgi:hypothetical protein